MAHDNKTDYTKHYMDLLELLPRPYQSDVNISLFNNLFNRFLTKQEIDKISGYIGRGNANALISRQIKEINVHRQAFQLQPILYDKIGSIEHMASWKDIQNELERLGIDIDDLPNWGAVQKFNWVPPIDINKLINYQDYYWTGSSRPQYITIRSRCATASARLSFWDGLITQYGSTMSVVDILPADNINSLPIYSVATIDSSINLIVVADDATADLSSGDHFDITGTAQNNGTYKVSTAPSYNGTTNLTTITVTGFSSPTIPTETVGTLNLRRFDKIVLGANSTITNGDYTRLMSEGLLLFLRSFPNTELNNTFVKVIKSEADSNNFTTTVTIDFTFTDNTFTNTGSPVLVGEASLEEQRTIFEADKKCQCDELGGWDDSLWDDNPFLPLWGDTNPADGISDHKNLLDAITNSGPPSLPPPSDPPIWYDITANRLYEYDSILGWVIIWNNFSLVLDATKGFALWDLTLECDTRPRIKSAEQWIKQNKWLHKNSITNFASVKRAIQPIIEYDWDLELNEWTYIDYRWSYRDENDSTFIETDTTPALIELEPITWWELDLINDPTGKTIIVDSRYGDQTDWFTPTKKLYIGDDNAINIYEVDYSEYKTPPVPSNHPYRTYVKLTTSVLIGSPGGSTGDLSLLKPNTQSIFPFETINGDSWLGYGVHWLFLGSKDAVPVPHQVDNPYIEIENGAIPIQYPAFGSPAGSPAQVLYEYTSSSYSENYLVIDPAGTDTFYLSDDIPTGETRSLQHKALYGTDDIRVYTSNIIGGDSTRQFGTYEEIGEAVINVLDVFNNEFVIPTGLTAYFSVGDQIELYGNTGIGQTTFDVTSKGTNRIGVGTGSPIVDLSSLGVAGNGEIRNLTNPLRTDLPGFNLTNSKDVTIYVAGIKFPTNIAAQLNVTVEVGPASIEEIGRHHNMVRTIEGNNTFNVSGSSPVSRIQYRRVEQVKTKINQYPLFDIFKITGEAAFKANPIFGYKTSPDADINTTGLRIVFNQTDNVYEFDQFLLDEDNGELFAYRDYENKEEDHWYNPETNEVFFWKGVEWSDKTEMDDHYRRAVVSGVEPTLRERNINGLYWYNTTIDVLFKRFNPLVGTGTWIEVSPIDRYLTDINLQTIWKAGNNNEEYIPEKVDWKRRSKEEYDIEKQDYVVPRVEELMIEDPSLSEAQAMAIATIEWYKNESNDLSPTGVWIGDWEIPDPLYFNNQHENRKHITSRELLTHFVTILDAQKTIPGYSGSKDGMFNLIPIDEVNYGVGGTIKEFNDGFDTMLSSVFVNNVTPRSLIEFAHDQYEGQLNFLKEIYRKNSLELFTNLEIDNILDLSSFISDAVILQYELNDQAAFVYGDTTTFTDVDGVNDLGVRNWIATLPYVNLVNKKVPERIIDEQLSLNEVVHHDGHRNEYALASSVADIISQLILRATDPRTGDDIGRFSTNLPPNNITEFNASFNSISNREGVYWYYTPTGSEKTLYRYVVAESGINVPPSTYKDGTLWMDLTAGSEVLRIKNTDFQGIVTWDIVDGLTIGDQRLHNGTNPADLTTATVSAWQKIDLDIILGDIIFDLENRLYENVPEFPILAYDFAKLESENPTKYKQYLEEAFLDYVSQSEINTPYLNSDFSATDPFTWNYLRSAQGGAITILEADGLTNSFLVAGNKVSTFDPCSDLGACPSTISFYVKNSDVNNGTWTTLTSTLTTPSTLYNALDNTTKIFVDADVLDSQIGIIYSGVLPSLKTQVQLFNLNDGSESGGDWRDLYQKIYGTPYPHQEPWVLQGYFDKPDWWDIEYLNDDVNKWGKRTWKHKHGFSITTAYNDTGNTYGTFEIDGDFSNSFVSAVSFIVDNSIDHAGTYTVGNRDNIITVNAGGAGSASFEVSDATGHLQSVYLQGMLLTIVEPINNTIIKTYTVNNVNHSGLISTITIDESIAVGDISVGDYINGSLYHPITNKTQIKITTLVSNTNATGRITKAVGMWENIRLGNIPPGRSYPNGVIGITGIPSQDVSNYGLSVNNLPTFSYFSVNIDNVPVTTDSGITVYEPDAVFPPFWDHTIVYTSTPSSFDTIVRSLYFDFSTEIVSPNANYVFGDAGPIEWEWRSLSQFLYDQLTVAYRIDPVRYVSSTFGFNYTEIGRLQADRNTLNTPSHTRTNFHGDIINDKQIKINGLNQWYVNFNRYSGYDANFSDFSQLWTGWTAPLMYQFSSFIDTPSLSVNHRYVNISNFDYEITSKRAPGVEDFWVDAFKVSITNIAPNIVRYDNQLDWRFELKTNISASRNIKYYDVHNYQFRADETTDECSLYTWSILNVDTFNKTFEIKGDQIHVFIAGSQFDIIGSTGNDGTYDVLTSTYDTISNTTTILVENVIADASTIGLIKANYRTIPWETGAGVYLSTAETLPIPLDGDTVNGLTKYFIIKVSDTTFKLALTEQDAIANTFIDLTSMGVGDHFVGQLLTTFLANNGVRSDTNWRYYALDKSNILEFNTPHEVQGIQTLVNIVNGYDSYSNDQGWKVNGDKSEVDPATGSIVSWQVEIERFITFAFTQRVVREQTTDRYSVTVDDTTDIWTFVEDNKTFITADPVTILSSNAVFPAPISQGLQYYIIRDTLATFRLAATKQDAQNGIAIDILSSVGVGNLTISTPKEFSSTIPEFEINPFRNKIWIQPARGIISNILAGPSEDIRTTQLIFDQDGKRLTLDRIRVYRQDKETKISVVDPIQVGRLPINVSPYNLIHLGGLHLFVDAYEHVMKMNNYTSQGNLLYDPFIGLNVTKYEMLFNRQPIFTQRPNVGGYYLETFFNQGANIKENFEAAVENLRYAYDTYDVLESNKLVKSSRDSLGYEGITEYLSNLNLSEKSQFLFWRGQIQAKGSINAVKAFINSRRFIDAKIDDFWAIKIAEFGSMGELEFPEMYVTTIDSRSNELRLEFIDNDALDTSAEQSFTPIKMSDQVRWYNQPDQISVLRNNGKSMYFDLKITNKMTAVIPANIINNNGKNFIKHDLTANAVIITQNGIELENEAYPLGSPAVPQYREINANIIQIIDNSIITAGADLIVYGMVFKDDAQNPLRIIDRDTETQISPIQFWDPARGKHYSNAIHNIDLQNDVDPAEYTDTPKSSGDNTWSDAFVGTSWFNTENLDYVPYYSEKMIPDITERFRSWGQLADWSDIVVYEWVESDVPPSEWDDIAQTEEGDRTIPEAVRKSGIARKVLFEKDNGSPQTWMPLVNKFDEQYVATNSIFSTPNYTFDVDLTSFKATGSPLQYSVDVYINGRFKETASITAAGSPVTTGQYIISNSDIKEADVVRFVQPVPTDQTVIDEEIAAGTMLQEYEFTQVPFYDELGNLNVKYYFWVGNKGTKPSGKNRTMSTFGAQIQLESMPAAHMFLQNIKPAISVSTDDTVATRIETFNNNGSPPEVLGSPPSVSLGLNIASGTTVLVELDGVDLIQDDISYIADGTSNTVSILVSLLGVTTVKVTYIGVITNRIIDLPYRYTQIIIRGLQGIVTADRRYTVRFTRNFTLRDRLDVEDEGVGNIDLKNHHEEWKLFRKEQQFNIDRWQWDKITESIVGYKLAAPDVRVPSYERELYDEGFGTGTQYGLGENQTFVNGSLALRSIIAYLIDPDVDFTPLDINVFFANNSFDTNENIIKAMDEIYNTFAFTDVNRMYFSVLNDAFTTKAKYREIFKTSMISLHGIRPFQTAGIFDD